MAGRIPGGYGIENFPKCGFWEFQPFMPDPRVTALLDKNHTVMRLYEAGWYHYNYADPEREALWQLGFPRSRGGKQYPPLNPPHPLPAGQPIEVVLTNHVINMHRYVFDNAISAPGMRECLKELPRGIGWQPGTWLPNSRSMPPEDNPRNRPSPDAAFALVQARTQTLQTYIPDTNAQFPTSDVRSTPLPGTDANGTPAETASVPGNNTQASTGDVHSTPTPVTDANGTEIQTANMPKALFSSDDLRGVVYPTSSSRSTVYPSDPGRFNEQSRNDYNQHLPTGMNSQIDPRTHQLPPDFHKDTPQPELFERANFSDSKSRAQPPPVNGLIQFKSGRDKKKQPEPSNFQPYDGRHSGLINTIMNNPKIGIDDPNAVLPQGSVLPSGGVRMNASSFAHRRPKDWAPAGNKRDRDAEFAHSAQTHRPDNARIWNMVAWSGQAKADRDKFLADIFAKQLAAKYHPEDEALVKAAEDAVNAGMSRPQTTAEKRQEYEVKKTYGEDWGNHLLAMSLRNEQITAFENMNENATAGGEAPVADDDTAMADGDAETTAYTAKHPAVVNAINESPYFPENDHFARPPAAVQTDEFGNFIHAFPRSNAEWAKYAKATLARHDADYQATLEGKRRRAKAINAVYQTAGDPGQANADNTLADVLSSAGDFVLSDHLPDDGEPEKVPNTAEQREYGDPTRQRELVALMEAELNAKMNPQDDALARAAEEANHLEHHRQLTPFEKLRLLHLRELCGKMDGSRQFVRMHHRAKVRAIAAARELSVELYEEGLADAVAYADEDTEANMWAALVHVVGQERATRLYTEATKRQKMRIFKARQAADDAMEVDDDGDLAVPDAGPSAARGAGASSVVPGFPVASAVAGPSVVSGAPGAVGKQAGGKKRKATAAVAGEVNGAAAKGSARTKRSKPNPPEPQPAQQDAGPAPKPGPQAQKAADSRAATSKSKKTANKASTNATTTGTRISARQAARQAAIEASNAEVPITEAPAVQASNAGPSTTQPATTTASRPKAVTTTTEDGHKSLMLKLRVSRALSEKIAAMANDNAPNPSATTVKGTSKRKLDSAAGGDAPVKSEGPARKRTKINLIVKPKAETTGPAAAPTAPTAPTAATTTVNASADEPLITSVTLEDGTTFTDPGAGNRETPEYLSSRDQSTGWVASSHVAVRVGTLLPTRCRLASAYMRRVGKWEPTYWGYKEKPLKDENDKVIKGQKVVTNEHTVKCSWCQAHSKSGCTSLRKLPKASPKDKDVYVLA